MKIAPGDIPAILRRSRRILIVGCPGSGKTTLALRLGVILSLPVVQLDERYFAPGWRPRPREHWWRTVERLCDAPQWIIDGNHASTLALRLARADAVVLLDRAPVLCLASYLRRLVAYARADHEDLPRHMRLPGKRRRIADRPLAFARFILTYRRRQLPAIAKQFVSHPGVPTIVLRNRASALRVLTDLSRHHRTVPFS